jgi:hypothetical protein
MRFRLTPKQRLTALSLGFISLLAVPAAQAVSSSIR